MSFAVINNCFGGFGLSSRALRMLGRGGDEVSRTDERLVATVRNAANGPHADLLIVPLRANSVFVVSDMDGMETIGKDHDVFFTHVIRM